MVLNEQLFKRLNKKPAYILVELVVFSNLLHFRAVFFEFIVFLQVLIAIVVGQIIFVKQGVISRLSVSNIVYRTDIYEICTVVILVIKRMSDYHCYTNLRDNAKLLEFLLF